MTQPVAIRDIDLTPKANKTYADISREWREEFIYFALIDRFHDDQVRTPVLQAGRATGISTQDDFFGGKIKGITDHLDYIAGLGCTAIWVSPIFENNPHAYHGYDINNYLSVDPNFGTEQDLINLVDAAHNFKKAGKPFPAYLVMDEKGKVTFEFPPREGKGRTKSSEPPPKIDFTGKTVVGKCPKCDGQVFDTEAGYICENSQRAEKRCTFKPIGKTILEQPIDAVQAAKILKDKKSDVMEKFISKSGKPFPAFLVMDKKGKITFEFPASDDE